MESHANNYLINSYLARELSACTEAHLALPQVHQATNDVQPFYQGGACVDSTRRKQTTTALCLYDATLTQWMVERTARLEHSNHALEHFAYAASHELKSSLHAMMHLANWIGEDTVDILPASSKEHLAKLRRQIKRMEQLLNDLLAYTRAEHQRYPPERVDTAVLVQEVVELLAVPSSFMVTIDTTLPIIAAERMPLAAVFHNLIDNILKHHPQPPAGHVAVSAHTIGSWIEFRTIDDGSGIDPTFHERIFQGFQTLKSRDHRGSIGRGLAVVKKLVESRGGTIAVEARAGCGATFRFTWPKEPAPDL